MAPAAPAETVLTERIGAVLLVTLNRPRVSNAADAATSYRIDAILNDAEADDSIGAVVLTGAGDRAFCSGMDLKEAALRGPGHGLVPGRGFCGITERTFSKPLICAVNGAAVAGGMEIALACDVILAAENAVFGLAEVKRGLVAFAGGVQRLAKQLPRSAALEIIFTAEPASAQRMHQLGVVSRVVPRERLVAEAVAMAQTMLANSWPALRWSKQLFDASCDLSLPESLALGHRMGKDIFANADSAEGVKAYAQKRVAQFGSEGQGP